MEKTKPKYHLKVIVCGAGAVGKTSIIRRYVEDKFDFNYLLTVGMEPSNRVIEIFTEDNNSFFVNLVIFDVAGQKRFQILREVFFKGAHAALLVFDLTRPDTLEELILWKKQIESKVGDIPIILVGNKCDIEEEINIDYRILEDEAIPSLKAKKYFETSAYLDKNIREVFYDITVLALKNLGKLP